jgi:ribosomal protein L6P/L9E
MYKKNKEEISKKEMIELSKKGLSPLTMDMKELEGITHIEIQNWVPTKTKKDTPRPFRVAGDARPPLGSPDNSQQSCTLLLINISLLDKTTTSIFIPTSHNTTIKYEKGRCNVDILNIEEIKKEIGGKEVKEINKWWSNYKNILISLNKEQLGVWKQIIEVRGTGNRIEIKEGKIKVDVGKSHEVELKIPQNVIIEGDKTQITLTGTSKNKHLLSQFIAQIHRIKPLNIKSQGFVTHPPQYIIRAA